MITKENYESWFLDYVEKQLSPEQVAELFLFLESHPELKEEFESFELTVLSDFSEVSFDNKHELHKPVYTEAELEELIPAAAEGDLNKQQLAEFEKAISSFPFIEKAYRLQCQLNFRDTDAVPSPDKTFYYKQELSMRTIDAWLIAEVEGDLNSVQLNELETFVASNKEAAVMRGVYQQTKLETAAVNFPDKSSLYRKRVKVISIIQPRIWWAAACLLLMFGIWQSLQHNDINNQVAVINPAETTAVIHAPFTKGISTNVSQPEKKLTHDKHSFDSVKSDVVKNADINSKENVQPVNHPAEQLAVEQERIEILPLKQADLIKEEEPFAYAERRLIRDLPSDNRPAELPPAERLLKLTEETTTALLNNATDGVINAPDASGRTLPLGSRLIRVAAWALGKVSDDRIKIKTTFNPLNGSLAACQVETGNKKWQKEF